MADFENQIETTLNEVGRAQRSAGEEQDRVERVRQSLRTLYNGMQTGLREGSYEPNDEILAGVVAIYGDRVADRLELIGDFKELDRKLKGKSGEQVLIVRRHENQIGCTGFGGTGQTIVETLMMLGDLNGENLIFDYAEQTCSLPTSRFVFNTPRQRSVNIGISNIEIAHSRLGLPNTIDVRNYLHHTVGDWSFLGDKPSSSERFPALEILIGNEEVESWSSDKTKYFDRHSQIADLEVLRDHLYSDRLF